MLLREIFGHKEEIIERFAGPVPVAELFDGEEKNAAAQSFARAQELLALFEGADAENGEGAIAVHASDSVRAKISRIILWTPPQDTRIAKMGRRARPRRLRCARRLRLAGNEGPCRAASRFAEGCREILRHRERCAGLPACRCRARCAGGVRMLESEIQRHQSTQR